MNDKIIDEVKRISNFSTKTKDFIRGNIDEIFLCDILDHRCSKSSTGVSVCHLDPSSCWIKRRHLNGLTCADTIETASVTSVVQKNPFFINLSEQHNFTSCLLEMGDFKIILYRHFDERGFGMTQWDRDVPDDIWEELVPAAKKLNVIYKVPFVFPTRIKA